MRVEKSYRGISERLARHYLSNLGGEIEDDEIEDDEIEDDEPESDSADSERNDADSDGDTSEAKTADDASSDGDVVGDGWRASISSEKVSIGPSVKLTEVTVVFEGDEEALEPLVEDFSQKAIRAGG